MKTIHFLSFFLFFPGLIFAQIQVPVNSQSPIYYNGPKVGIGIQYPNFNMEIAGDLGVAGNRFNVQQGIINQTSTINNWGSGSNEGGIAFNYDGRISPTSTSQTLFRDFSIYNGKGSIISFWDGSTGFVGISTMGPSEKLEVLGGNFSLKAFGTDAGDIIFKNGSNSQLGRIWTNSSGESGLYLSSGDNASDIAISNSGNVGIGTSSPSEQLQIGDRWVFHNGGHKIIGYNYTYDNSQSKRIFDDESALIRFEDDGDIRFETVPYGVAGSLLSGSSSTIIKNNGNVGIGVLDPIYKLTVDGTISASEIKVSTTPNSDYVFEPDYNLKSLSEVESFIKENKHLPEIPSAEEFKQNGVGLGEMDDMLLRKIEELTLYSIEQNKSIKQQQRIIEEQQSQINCLFEIIKKLENE